MLRDKIRQPVVVVLGHVDSGKTSLLDKIRGTAVQAREAGGITQHIGASFFPLETLAELCGPLLKQVGGEVQIPGLLVIDTPGHEVFTNLRARGGSAADIAILVVDVLRGFEAQTYESLEILKGRRVPFVVALNKLDLLPGWRPGPSFFVTESLRHQGEEVRVELDRRIYEVVGTLSRLGFGSEAFWRVRDFTREVAIVPVSAKTGEGIPELMAVLVGLTQQYLRRRLAVSEREARGIVLEIREEVGLGHTANAILLDGVLRAGQPIVVAKRAGAVVTRVRAIFMPKPLDEMRDPRDRFTPVEMVQAAAGVKVAAPDLEGVLAGSPFLGLEEGQDVEEARRQVEQEVSAIFIETDREGVVVKADTLGSLEALVQVLHRRGVAVRLADIGPVSKRDVVEAAVVRERDPYQGVILAFGVKVSPDAEREAAEREVPLFTDPLIYNLVDGYLKWVQREREDEEKKLFERLTPPCKFQILQGYIFRRSDPAIFGVEVLLGRLRQKVRVITEAGREVGAIHQIQDKGRVIEEADVGAQVAVSMKEPIVGRHIDEGMVLYTLPRQDELKLLKDRFRGRLREDEAQALEELVAARRKVDPLYGF